MKKIAIPFFSILLVVTLLLSVSVKSAAMPLTPPSLPEPYVTPVSGDMEFTTELLPVQRFPGAQEYNQMLVPVGFPLGEAQFLDTGVVVSGMDSGKATACFYFTGAESGWGGKVGVWNGSKWVLLPTTIKNLEESVNSLACAPITGNGTYVFIRYVADASLLPANNSCGYEIFFAWWSSSDYESGDGWETGYIEFFVIGSDTDLTGKTVTVTLLRSEPVGGFVWYGTATGVLIDLFPGYYYIDVIPPVYYEWDLDQWNQPTWLLDFGNCTQEVSPIIY